MLQLGLLIQKIRGTQMLDRYSSYQLLMMHGHPDRSSHDGLHLFGSCLRVPRPSPREARASAWSSRDWQHLG
jgi:hypothetical protein